MENTVIVIIITILIAVAVRSTARHLKRKGGCCGGGDYKPRKKKLPNVIYEKRFQVEGMHCERCKNRVEEVVNDMAGVVGKVNLQKGELVVSYAEQVGDKRIASRIEKAGYTVKVL